MQQEQMLTFGSVCSGISAASVSWNPLGWRAAWFHEIEPFPSSLLAQRYPYAENHGDMRTAPDRIRNGELSAPDILGAGTPCQAFSIGGARRSLDDERGNLTLTFCEIADAIDERRAAAGQPPCRIVWENVRGVLSTKDNAFGCLIGKLAGCDEALEPGPRPEQGRSSQFWTWEKTSGEHVAKWPRAGVVAGPLRTVAWRVLDAEHFGLPQHRERVFVVASARDGFDPAEVLPEWESDRRDHPPGRGPGGIHPCLTASGGGALDDREAYVLEPDGIRRTTVIEWERCQGFPDDYTLIEHRGKPAADGPRYKAIGNSWAVNCTRWIGQRIQRELDRIGALAQADDDAEYRAWCRADERRMLGRTPEPRDAELLGLEAAPAAIECEINRTGDYVQTMSVRRVPALADTFDVRFESQLLTAKNPSERHLKHQFLASSEALAGIISTLEVAIGKQPEISLA